MQIRTLAPLAIAVLLAAPMTSHAKISAYSQDFDSLAPADPFPGSNNALADDGWRYWVNVYNPNWSFAYGYGDPAPNGLWGISGVGTGGSVPGNQNMGVYSAYNEGSAHDGGLHVETNVFQTRTIDASDVGTTWKFQFDARWFNLAAPSTAAAFIHTQDPSNGQISASLSVDLSAIPDRWGTYVLPYTISASAGKHLVFGFYNSATNRNPSTIVVDNVSLLPVPEPSTYVMMLAGLGLLAGAARRRKH